MVARKMKVCAITAIVIALAMSIAFVILRPIAAGNDYQKITVNPTSGEIELIVNPEVYCDENVNEEHSSIQEFSYQFRDDALQLYEWKSGGEDLLQLLIYCRQTMADLMQPVANEALNPKEIGRERNLIITQRDDVVRFIIFGNHPIGVDISGQSIPNVITRLFRNGGVAVGACYSEKSRCYMGIGGSSSVPSSGAMSEMHATDAMDEVSMLWVGIDVDESQQLDVSKAAGLLLLTALRRGQLELQPN